MVNIGKHLSLVCHSYGSLCCVVTIRAAPYLYCEVAVMFLALGVGSVLGWVFSVTISEGMGWRYFYGWWGSSKASKILLGDILCSSFK